MSLPTVVCLADSGRLTLAGMPSDYCTKGLLTAIAAIAVALAASSAQAQKMPLGAGLPAVSLSGPCLPTGKSYLRAHIRGAVRLDIDLHRREQADDAIIEGDRHDEIRQAFGVEPAAQGGKGFGRGRHA